MERKKGAVTGAGVASLVMGIVGFIMFGIILGPLAIIFGAIAWSKDKDKLGLAGLILGIIDLIVPLILIGIVGFLVSELGGRGVPPAQMLTVVATDTGDSVTLDISHQGGDDLAISDFQIKATDSATGGMATIDGTEMIGVGSTLSAGETGSVIYAYPGVDVGDVLTVYIVHVSSKQKIFSSSTVVVQ